ncbi:hypothetical protein [Vibrio mediterranei]|uniref:hypothetical protein n=1 Tax=Vibrio mediterranei TaxID=689 RepID=UPI00148B686F|nr:hypothetical protein [Vibrio mediterranei]EMC9392573.1 hypothetical protein [Vibrio parahaemolyticus]NOH31019.1 hypothetical protein [Vibrio mediterranei]CAH6828293.1 conserved hypothetical protein [Vibrio chagasii]
MNIFTPKILSRCSDRSIKARTNTLSGGPEDWFTEVHLSQLGIQSISFDFFVNWQRNVFMRTIWFKRFIDINTRSLIQRDDWQESLITRLIEHEGPSQLSNLFNFCCSQEIFADFLVFNERFWNENDPIIYARLTSPTSFDVKAISLNQLKLKISHGTGRPFNIGQKGLFYSTSNLECYLSRTDTPYPGDADILLWNRNRNGFKLIEFKKHNLKDPIHSQKLSNYYPRPDGAKYRRLHILSQYLPNTQLYTLYYTTDNRFQTKIELNSVSGSNLSEGRSILLESPKDKNDTNGILNYLSNCVQFFNSN